MIPKPKWLRAQGPTSSSTVALAAAARSTAAAVEELAKMASEKGQKPTCPVSSDDAEQQGPSPSAKARAKARAMAKIGPTLPVLDHAAAAASSAAASGAQSSACAPAHLKAATFAGRYPPVHPQRRVGWDNMVQDYDQQKEEDKKNGKKRKMTQGEWYTIHAARYGLQIRKRQKKPSANPGGPSAGEDDGAGGGEVSPPVMKKPSANPGGPSAGEDDGAGGEEVSPPGISENGGHVVEEDAEEEENQQEEEEEQKEEGEEVEEEEEEEKENGQQEEEEAADEDA